MWFRSPGAEWSRGSPYGRVSSRSKGSLVKKKLLGTAFGGNEGFGFRSYRSSRRPRRWSICRPGRIGARRSASEHSRPAGSSRCGRPGSRPPNLGFRSPPATLHRRSWTKMNVVALHLDSSISQEGGELPTQVSIAEEDELTRPAHKRGRP